MMTLSEYKKITFDYLRDRLAAVEPAELERYLKEIEADVEWDYKNDIEERGEPTPYRHTECHVLCF